MILGGAIAGKFREWKRRLSSSSSPNDTTSSTPSSSFFWSNNNNNNIANHAKRARDAELPHSERMKNLSLAKRAVHEMRRAEDDANALSEETRTWLSHLTHDDRFLDYCRRGFRRVSHPSSSSSSSSPFSVRGSYHLNKVDEEELSAITECLERLSREDPEANRRLMLSEDLCFELVKYAMREDAFPHPRLNLVRALISMAKADASLLCAVTALEVTDLPSALFKRTNCSKETLLAARDLHLLVRERGCGEEELRSLGVLGSSTRSSIASYNNNVASSSSGEEPPHIPTTAAAEDPVSPTNSTVSLHSETWGSTVSSSSSSSTSSIHDKGECTLCYGPLADRVRLLPCSHAFCFDCVVSWNLCYQGPSPSGEEDFPRARDRCRKPCALCRSEVKSIQFF